MGVSIRVGAVGVPLAGDVGYRVQKYRSMLEQPRKRRTLESAWATGCTIQGAGCTVQGYTLESDVGYRVHDTGYRVHGTRRTFESNIGQLGGGTCAAMGTCVV